MTILDLHWSFARDQMGSCGWALLAIRVCWPTSDTPFSGSAYRKVWCRVSLVGSVSVTLTSAWRSSEARGCHMQCHWGGFNPIQGTHLCGEGGL